jgi:hypothetical protein
MGYEACSALLNYYRSQQSQVPNRQVRYNALPIRLRVRTRAAKACACKPTRACETDASCVLVRDGTLPPLCIPRAAATQGFDGANPRPNQREHVRDRERVRRASRVRNDAALRRDRDSMADRTNNHSSRLRYSSRGRQLWRHAGPIVRMPILRA